MCERSFAEIGCKCSVSVTNVARLALLSATAAHGSTISRRRDNRVAKLLTEGEIPTAVRPWAPRVVPMAQAEPKIAERSNDESRIACRLYPNEKPGTCLYSWLT